MTGIQKTCADELAAIGALSCTKNNPFLDVVSLLVVKAGFEFASFVDFADVDKYQDAIKAKTMFPIHEVFEIDDNSEESLYYESPTGKRVPRRLGAYRHVYKFNKSLAVHKALQTFRNANVDFFTIDSSGNICGFTPDGVKVKGFSISMFNPEKMTSAMQDNTPAWTPIVVDQLDAKQWNEKGITVKPGWLIGDLIPLSAVRIKLVSAAAGTATINVSYIDGLDSDGSENAIGISGILMADFIFTGAVPTPAAMVDLGDGNYTFPGATMNTGTVDLKKAAVAATTGDPIENFAGTTSMVPA